MSRLPPGSHQPRTLKTSRNGPNVIKRAKFAGQPGSDEARAKVGDLQKQIEVKEAELLRMKEALARSDVTDVTAAQMELNRLQAAFDKAQKMSDSRLDPVVQKLQDTQAEFESKKFRMKMFHRAAKERDQALRLMQQRIDIITAELEAPEVLASDESPIKSLLNNSQRLQHDIECTHRTKQLTAYTEKAFHHINDVLDKSLTQQRERENRSIRKNESTKQETEVRARRTQQVIDDEWVLARHTMDKLRIMLEDAKRSVRFLNETAEQLSNSNKRVTEDLADATDELEELSKYLPNAPHTDTKKGDGVSRTDLTVMEMQKDFGEVLLDTGRMKTQALKSSLESLRSKVAEMPALVKRQEQELEQTCIERENAENSLQQAHDLRAELLSRKTFAEQEEQLLMERIEKQRVELEKIKQETEDAKAELQKQKTTMLLNEELQNLKTMNFDRFTSTISNLMDIKSRM